MSHDVTHIIVDKERLAALLGTTTIGMFTAPNSERCHPLELLDWNREAAGAVQETLAMVELVVRQAMNSELVKWADARSTKHWLRLIEMDAQMQLTVQRALKNVSSSSGRERMDEIPFHLPFGFWRYLITPRRHAALWVPALHSAFPHGNEDLLRRREETSRDLEALVRLRNRVAHHDPIFRRDLLQDFQIALRLSRSIDPVAGAWVKRNSRLPVVAKSNPWLEKL